VATAGGGGWCREQHGGKSTENDAELHISLPHCNCGSSKNKYINKWAKINNREYKMLTKYMDSKRPISQPEKVGSSFKNSGFKEFILRHLSKYYKGLN